MNQLIFILFALYLGNISIPKSNKVCWNEERLLSWKNYKGKPNYRTLLDAVTSISISYSIISKDEVSIDNCIIENKSWVKNNAKTHALLKHEQFHFHLSEVIARKMRRDVSLVKVPTISTIKTIYDKWMLEFDEIQRQYDEETNHSQNDIEQLKWQERIEIDLKDLDRFKNRIVILTN